MVGIVISIGGCDWVTFHAGPDRTGLQRGESAIGVSNVASLSQARTYPGAASAPVVVNGVLYVVNATLYAFDATGASGCSGSPTSCTPLWTAAAPNATGLTVASGTVFVTLGSNGVRAFDAAGSTNCGGVPKVCSPLWTTPGSPFLAGGFPAVVNGVLYVTGGGDGVSLTSGGAYVLAFDANGSTNCSGAPKKCAPLWTTTGAPISQSGAAGSLAIANGVIFVGAAGKLFAFDADGSINCSGTPKVCAPLWTGAASSIIYSSPSVSNGTVFLGGWDGKLYAFDATGTTNCSGSPKTCTPMWTTTPTASIGATAAIANGVVYVVATNGSLAAYDVTGTSGCSGSPKTCKPLWTFAPGGGSGNITESSPAVANGVVYFMSVTGTLYGVDATGTTNCSGTPKTCTALWSANSGKSGDGSPAVVNGVVYVDRWGDNTVYAYSH